MPAEPTKPAPPCPDSTVPAPGNTDAPAVGVPDSLTTPPFSPAEAVTEEEAERSGQQD